MGQYSYELILSYFFIQYMNYLLFYFLVFSKLPNLVLFALNSIYCPNSASTFIQRAELILLKVEKSLKDNMS